MSERMTDEEAKRLCHVLRINGMDAGADEVKRARASEKALADALWNTGDEYPEVGWHTNSCIMEGVGIGKDCTDLCAERRVALRLAGRL